ncbi:MAG TPA: winged helix-turn-helix domain-containing protein [Verrucomicrobiota bacterium]|nr:winged helix-turn-helix domain-containing protein [Verrucomicrobiota bacterium]HNS70371.1 winged helix-turn-helix domain-containing protein [Verrucomicrobiota bacterium]
MRRGGSRIELEQRHGIAIRALLRGYTVEEVADFLGVAPRSVWRWQRVFRKQGTRGLAAAPVSGRPTKLTHTQEKIVLRWLGESPIEHGFANQLWTAERLAGLVQREFGVQFHPHYLSTWVRQRGITPQKPQRRAREADPKVIAAWLAEDWPRIKKKPTVEALP